MSVPSVSRQVQSPVSVSLGAAKVSVPVATPAPEDVKIEINPYRLIGFNLLNPFLCFDKIGIGDDPLSTYFFDLCFMFSFLDCNVPTNKRNYQIDAFFKKYKLHDKLVGIDGFLKTPLMIRSLYDDPLMAIEGKEQFDNVFSLDVVHLEKDGAKRYTHFLLTGCMTFFTVEAKSHIEAFCRDLSFIRGFIQNNDQHLDHLSLSKKQRFDASLFVSRTLMGFVNRCVALKSKLDCRVNYICNQIDNNEGSSVIKEIYPETNAWINNELYSLIEDLMMLKSYYLYFMIEEPELVLEDFNKSKNFTDLTKSLRENIIRFSQQLDSPSTSLVQKLLALKNKEFLKDRQCSTILLNYLKDFQSILQGGAIPLCFRQLEHIESLEEKCMANDSRKRKQPAACKKQTISKTKKKAEPEEESVEEMQVMVKDEPEVSASSRKAPVLSMDDLLFHNGFFANKGKFQNPLANSFYGNASIAFSRLQTVLHQYLHKNSGAISPQQTTCFAIDVILEGTLSLEQFMTAFMSENQRLTDVSVREHLTHDVEQLMCDADLKNMDPKLFRFITQTNKGEIYSRCIPNLACIPERRHTLCQRILLQAWSFQKDPSEENREILLTDLSTYLRGYIEVLHLLQSDGENGIDFELFEKELKGCLSQIKVKNETAPIPEGLQRIFSVMEKAQGKLGLKAEDSLFVKEQKEKIQFLFLRIRTSLLNMDVNDPKSINFTEQIILQLDQILIEQYLLYFVDLRELPSVDRKKVDHDIRSLLSFIKFDRALSERERDFISRGKLTHQLTRYGASTVDRRDTKVHQVTKKSTRLLKEKAVPVVDEGFELSPKDLQKKREIERVTAFLLQDIETMCGLLQKLPSY